jgi:hypothetical protein
MCLVSRTPALGARERVPHRALDPDRSTEFQPVQSHLKEEKLRPGEIVPVDIEIVPTSRFWHKGQYLRVQVAAATSARAGLNRSVGKPTTTAATSFILAVNTTAISRSRSSRQNSRTVTVFTAKLDSMLQGAAAANRRPCYLRLLKGMAGLLIGIGTDLFRISRIAPQSVAEGDPFLMRAYTEAERAEADGRASPFFITQHVCRKRSCL